MTRRRGRLSRRLGGVHMWLWVATALAGGGSAQTRFDAERQGATTTLHFGWRDEAGTKQSVDVAVPTADIEADRLEERYLDRRDMYEAAAKAVRAMDLPQVKLTAKIEDGGLRITAEGRGDVRAALQKAEATRDRAIADWLAANDGTQLDGGISFDHAKLVRTYAADLRPVADALAAGTSSDREFVERALSFVQSIPYESRRKKGKDAGYRRPLSVLGADKGDCDSKSVLFLGIVAAHLPSVPLAVVYVPDHALTGVGLPKEPGDKTFAAGDARFVYAEPVGPALLALGAKVPAGHKAKKGQVRVVPR